MQFSVKFFYFRFIFLSLDSNTLCRLFCGHIHATVGLVDQGCHCLSLNDMLGGN